MRPRRPEFRAQKFEGHYELLAVWPHEAALEDIVLDLLKPSKAQIGTSREHFDATASFEYICQIVQAARNRSFLQKSPPCDA